MIVFDSIVKSYGANLAVDKVSLNVAAGEIFGLVGPDGAGKTTVIRMLTGILAPTSGSLRVLEAANPEEVKDKLGYVPQRFSLYGDLTVMENIRVLGSLYGQDEGEIASRATAILSFTNLLPFKDRLADNLSGGMKQKLALAAGLMHRPLLYVLDEPTTGVDPVSRREFWRMLYKLNKEGTTVFVSTPYMDEAELCTRVAFMYNGRIVACDSPRGLRRAYPHKVLELATPGKNVKQLLADSSLLDINPFGDKYHLVAADADAAAAEVRAALNAAGVPIISLTEIPPTLEDVFVALASEVA
ncbi:ATP-binding cassette domain-containing protein [Anaeroselena agilis]|uniref:ABC transporter ATP-binding protein n=1 Tax=Anaeroselena agilis TaxID=3063788 RepID=A0ABU3P3R5_9FIRM|nr:ABC transporter ATP-binding protein [Selenomonadales bacterium 4137-cl]